MITLTRELIHRNRSPNGGWTQAQIEALGIRYPPRRGWIPRLHGKQVTEDQWRRFMIGKEVDAKQLRRIKKRGEQATIYQRPPAQETLPLDV